MAVHYGRHLDRAPGQFSKGIAGGSRKVAG